METHAVSYGKTSAVQWCRKALQSGSNIVSDFVDFRTNLVYFSQQISTSLKLYQCVTTAVKATATTERLSPGPPRSSAIEVAVLFSSAIHRLLLDTTLYEPLKSISI